MFVVTIIVFGIFFLDPAGPMSVARRIAGKSANQATVEMVFHRLGLNQPIVVQYWHFLWGSSQQNGLLKGYLGTDYYHGQSVNSIIGQAAPITFWLAIGAAIIWLVLGVSSGVVSAVR